MDIKKIKELVTLLDESNLSAVEVAEGETRVRLERNIVNNTFLGAQQNEFNKPAAETVSAVSKFDNAINFNNISEFRSPIIGVFYSGPSPDAKPFVRVGQRVKKGDILCILEAMKVLNEITSDRDGEIVDICAQNGQVVEYSQVLFKMF